MVLMAGRVPVWCGLVVLPTRPGTANGYRELQEGGVGWCTKLAFQLPEVEVGELGGGGAFWWLMVDSIS